MDKEKKILVYFWYLYLKKRKKNRLKYFNGLWNQWDVSACVRMCVCNVQCNMYICKRNNINLWKAAYENPSEEGEEKKKITWRKNVVTEADE